MDILLPIFIFVIATISFQKKILLKHLNFFELGMGNFIILLLLCMILYPILIKNNIININNFTTLSRYQIITYIFCAVSILTAGIGINYLLSKREATTVMPMIQSGIILTTLLLGCIVYRENITIKKVFASTLVILAIILLFNEK